MKCPKCSYDKWWQWGVGLFRCAYCQHIWEPDARTTAPDWWLKTAPSWALWCVSADKDSAIAELEYELSRQLKGDV